MVPFVSPVTTALLVAEVASAKVVHGPEALVANCTTKSLTALPPSFVGGAQLSEAEESRPVAENSLTAAGTVRGVALAVGEAGPTPAELTARTSTS